MENTLPKLLTAHPALFEGREQPGGFLPHGWYQLADDLCGEFERVLGERSADLAIWTIKPKFSQLRVYVVLTLPEPHGEPLALVVGAHAGGHSTTPRRRHPLQSAIADLIAAATKRSTRLCMWCGAPSQLLVDGGWLYTACPIHAEPGSITFVEFERRRKGKDTRRSGDGDGK